MKKNEEERLAFIDSWVRYIKTHSDKEWSKQQNILINSQLENAAGLWKGMKKGSIEFVREIREGPEKRRKRFKL